MVYTDEPIESAALWTDSATAFYIKPHFVRVIPGPGFSAATITKKWVVFPHFQLPSLFKNDQLLTV